MGNPLNSTVPAPGSGRYIAFLRAVNVGGRVAKMDALRACFENNGFTGVETFIASGNVIFSVHEKDSGKLSRRIEQLLQKELGYEVVTFVRTPAQLAAVAEHAAFSPDLLKEATALNVVFLAHPLSPETHARLRSLKTEIDAFHVNGTEIYWPCKKKQSESKFSIAVLERTIGAKATIRTISTVRKLAAKYPSH